MVVVGLLIVYREIKKVGMFDGNWIKNVALWKLGVVGRTMQI